MLSKEVLDDLKWHEENDKPYYRPLTYNGYTTLACMQWFDEYDYDEKRFFRDSNGKRYKFTNEKEGLEWLLENIKHHKIDPEYRTNVHSFF